MSARIRQLTMVLAAITLLLTTTGCIAPLLSEVFYVVGPLLLY